MTTGEFLLGYLKLFLLFVSILGICHFSSYLLDPEVRAKYKKKKALRKIERECQQVQHERRLSGDQHVIGYKHALIGYNNGRFYFVPARNKMVKSYSADDVAVCFYVKGADDGKLPHVSNYEPAKSEHHCGFYAVMLPHHLGQVPRSEPWRGTEQSAVKLVVDLYGRRIIHQYCYRAEKQRVLRVLVPHECGHDQCGATAQYLGFSSLVDFNVLSGDPRLTILRFFAETNFILTPLCAYHSQNGLPFSLVDVASGLGTEVIWEDEQFS